ncbi:MAG: hypothetical protein JNK58_01610 [Phycisphaerae bacterium]|nr:hypothetical protein [Phycisphaerae bacterium]
MTDPTKRQATQVGGGPVKTPTHESHGTKDRVNTGRPGDTKVHDDEDMDTSADPGGDCGCSMGGEKSKSPSQRPGEEQGV